MRQQHYLLCYCADLRSLLANIPLKIYHFRDNIANNVIIVCGIELFAAVTLLGFELLYGILKM